MTVQCGQQKHISAVGNLSLANLELIYSLLASEGLSSEMHGGEEAPELRKGTSETTHTGPGAAAGSSATVAGDHL